jgi:hypothetical protein
MVSPFSTDNDVVGATTGASLLVYALNGPDGLGTAGFYDRGALQSAEPGQWWDNMGADPNSDPPGAYAIGAVGDPREGEPLVPRYGPYANTDQLLERVRTFRDLFEKDEVFNPPSFAPWTSGGGPEWEHQTFTDNFGYPILYYRARRGARALVDVSHSSRKVPGVYHPPDNAAITGLQWSSPDGTVYNDEGLSPTGSGKRLHLMREVAGDVTPVTDVKELDPRDPAFAYRDTFEAYVADLSVSARPTPVNKDSFMLISPGRDGRYGTPDDIANFRRR